MKKVTVEAALNAELPEHLGHEKGQLKSGSNTRNGYSSKTVISVQGPIELDTPPDREGSFEPQLVKKHQNRITQMDSQILFLYAKGMMTRKIISIFKEMYDADVSPSLISKVTDAVFDYEYRQVSLMKSSLYPFESNRRMDFLHQYYIDD